MKKITLALAVALGAFTSTFAQTIEAPPDNNSTSAFRGPNGTSMHNFQRTVMYIAAGEMFPIKIGSLNTFSFQYTNGTNGTPVAGNFTIYLANTADLAYNKGTNYATAIASMGPPYYTGAYTVPGAAGAATMGVTLSTPFTYTGGGLYVAWDWATTGTPAVTTATYLCNNTQVWCATTDATLAPIGTALTGSNFRPSLLFGATNTATNEIEVFDIAAQGKVAKVFGAPQVITSEIINWGTNAVNNLSITLNVTGANTYNNTQVINLPPSSVQTLTWSSFNPTTNGIQTLSVSSNHTDQIMGNNSKVWTQSVTCDVVGMNPPTPTFNTAFGFGATGNIGLLYKVPSASSLTAIRLGVGNTTINIGNAISGVLMDNTGTIIDYSSNTITIASGNLGQFVTFNFPTKPLLSANTDYLFAVSQHSASNFPYGLMYETVFPAPLVYYTTPLIGGATPNQVTNAGGWLLIEPVFAFPGMVLTASAPSTVFCAGTTQAMTLTAAGAQSYTWSSPNVLGNGSTLTWTPAVTGAGTFTNIIVNGSFTTGLMTGCRTNSVSMLFQQVPCTGINEAAFAEVQMFPNPAVNGKSTIKGLTGSNTIAVYNTLGQAVINEKVGNDTYTLDLSSAASGTYIVKITNDANETKTIKFVNQH